MKVGSVGLWLVCALLACIACPAFAQEPATTPDTPAAGDGKKERAREHFQSGLEHFSRGEWDPALAEFLKSRQLFPTRSNTQNAAVALGHLGRNGEALEMFELLLREFHDIPQKDLDDVEREIRKLQSLVGSIDIRGAPTGATVMVDGRMRAKTPTRPVRATAGTHVVKVYKRGSLPFEQRVDVAAGEVEVVIASLTALAESGRLKVSESAGKPADVIVDGIVVGKAPWEGSVLPGNHAVSLKGEGTSGTPPANTPVRPDRSTVLALALERLDCALRIDPLPANAAVAIDRVDVGRGAWAGRLRCGTHRVELAAEGFLPLSRDVALQEGHEAVERLELDRDPDSPLWRAAHPPHIVLEAAFDGVLATTLGGDLENACPDPCTRSPVLGLFAGARGGYEWGNGIGLGATIGYLWVQRRLSNRATTVTEGPNRYAAVANDRETLRGAMFGLDGYLRRGESWPWMARLGVGVLVGSIQDRRDAVIDGSQGTDQYGPANSVVGARYAYLAPELRLGRRIGNWELSAGLRPIILLALTQPMFQDDELATSNSKYGLISFEHQALTGRTLFLLSAGVAVRYGFL
jgi:PEGA domain